MAQQINFMSKLQAALGPHTDLEFGRAATVAVLRQNAVAGETVAAFRAWHGNSQFQLPHDRWFQQVMRMFLHSLPGELTITAVIAGLERDRLPPTTAETLERWSRRCIVPGIRHRLAVQARRARLRERLIGARY